MDNSQLGVLLQPTAVQCGGMGSHLSGAGRLACLQAQCLQLKHLADAVQAAKQAGVASIAVPPPLSARGTFPDADYAFDGFGPGGGITWRRVDALLTKQSA